MRLAAGVVVAGVRPTVGLGDAQVGEQQGHRFGLHAGAAVGVQGQLAGADALLGTGRAAELFGQGGGLAGRDYPADGVSSPSASIGTERRCPPRVSRLQQ